MTRPAPVPPPGVVEVRLSDQMADIVRVTGLLGQVGAELIQTRGPRPNRRNPGVRVYLLIRDGQAEAASGPEEGR